MKNKVLKSFCLFLIRVYLFPVAFFIGYKRKRTSYSSLIFWTNFHKKRSMQLFWLHRNFLRTTGWLESMSSGLAVKNGDLIPWITYPALNYISRLPLGDLRVVEIGSGASTIFFAKNCKSVVTFEDDVNYLKKLIAFKNKENCDFEAFNLNLRSSTSYFSTIRELLNLDELNHFHLSDIASTTITDDSLIDITSEIDTLIKSIKTADLIFIDGWYRNTAIYLAGLFSQKSAIIVIDNSDANYTQLGRKYLLNTNFFEIEFRGLGPLNYNEWSTSIFSRNLNFVSKSLSK